MNWIQTAFELEGVLAYQFGAFAIADYYGDVVLILRTPTLMLSMGAVGAVFYRRRCKRADARMRSLPK